MYWSYCGKTSTEGSTKVRKKKKRKENRTVTAFCIRYRLYPLCNYVVWSCEAFEINSTWLKLEAADVYLPLHNVTDLISHKASCLNKMIVWPGSCCDAQNFIPAMKDSWASINRNCRWRLNRIRLLYVSSNVSAGCRMCNQSETSVPYFRGISATRCYHLHQPSTAVKSVEHRQTLARPSCVIQPVWSCVLASAAPSPAAVLSVDGSGHVLGPLSSLCAVTWSLKRLDYRSLSPGGTESNG